MAKVAVIEQPGGTRIDLFWVDSSGNLKQLWTTAPGQSWTNSGTIVSGCVASSDPDASYIGGNLNVFAHANGSVKHWWEDGGGTHSETLP